MQNRLAEAAPVQQNVSIRVVNDQGDVELVDLWVTEIDDEVERVDARHGTIGYIHRVGNIFVALAGDRTDRAEECGQFALWDHAAGELVHHADPRLAPVYRRLIKT